MSELERRYRRLLAWYHRDHREQNSDEMLGVLLAGAGDRTRPGWRDTADLLWGAARLHLRRVLAANGGVDAREVLAIVSLLGPVALLAGVTVRSHELVYWLRGPRDLAWHAQFPDAPLWCIWGVVAVLCLCRLRRTAAVGAWVGTAGFLVLATHDMQRFRIGPNSGWALLGVVIAVALTWSPGPARGWQLVGRKGIAVLAVGVAAAVAISVFGYRAPSLWTLALYALTIGAVLACGLLSRVGRRAAVVLLMPLGAAVLGYLVGAVATPAAVAVNLALPLVVLLALGGLPRRPAPRSSG